MTALEASTDPRIGPVIGAKFEIEALLGRGGMGAVYRARQENLRRAVAIKVVRHELRDERATDRARVVDLVGQLLAALAAVHDEGLVHRDLEPDDVMVVRGKDDDGLRADVLKLCDFGVAKRPPTPGEPGAAALTQTASLTANGALVGTRDPLSPEQAKGEAADALGAGAVEGSPTSRSGVVERPSTSPTRPQPRRRAARCPCSSRSWSR